MTTTTRNPYQLRVSALVVLQIAFFVFTSIGQTTSNQGGSNEWIGSYLDVAGNNRIDGVELNVKLAECDNENVILLQFKNHNNYSVDVEWADAVYKRSKEWIMNERQDKERIIRIEPEKTITGNCGYLRDEVKSQLVVKAEEYIKSPDEFQRFAPSYFVVTEIK